MEPGALPEELDPVSQIHLLSIVRFPDRAQRGVFVHLRGLVFSFDNGILRDGPFQFGDRFAGFGHGLKDQRHTHQGIPA